MGSANTKATPNCGETILNQTELDQFSVYTFAPEPAACSLDPAMQLPKRGTCCYWEKVDTFTDKLTAITTAEDLFRSGQYGRVEIKQKSFNKRVQRHVDSTIVVLGEKTAKEYHFTVSAALACASGIAAILICGMLIRVLII